MQPHVSYNKGDKLFNFIFHKVVKIEELQCVFYELEHIPTGAHIVHIANDDDENLFCLAFQTLPYSSNGISHILEHTVLCGSHKYPVKDPFFAMTRRSLNTFMNALTGADFTCYPAASQVKQDFYNLFEVYLDAVFHPILNKLSFLQEGCRLAFEVPHDPTSPLIYKGIVFNEMKGSMGSVDSRLWHTMCKHLMPDLPYAHNSGGDPHEIPDLTYEEFCKFHKDIYNPSRCLFYLYGNLPLENHLRFLEEKCLSHAKKLPALPRVPMQKRYKEPLHKIASYPTHEKDLSHKTIISFSWLTSPIKNQQDVLALSLLDSIFFDTDASPIKYALLQSKLCRQVDAFIDLEMSEIPLTITCKGCEEKNAEKLESILYDTLKELADKGIEQKLIDASLHQLEFSGMEITGDYYPFGLNLFFRSALAKLHGCTPEVSLLLYSQFETLHKLTQDPHYLPKLIRTYFLDNTHFVRLVMKPDPELEEEENRLEKEKLKKIQESLSKKEIDTILEETKKLEEFQAKSEHESVECLPKISIKDVPKKTKIFDLNKICEENTWVYHHETFTNHITYVNLVTSLPSLTEEELLYTKILTSLIGEVGVRDKDYTTYLEDMHAYTGGIGASLGIHAQCFEPGEIRPAIHLKGKALSRNIPHLFSLLKDTLLHSRLDEKARIKELILQMATEQQNRLNKQALSYAINLALCNNSNSTKLHHIFHGLKFYKFLQEIAKNIDSKLPELINHLKALQYKIFHNQNLDVVLTCNQSDYDWIAKEHHFGLTQLPKHPFTPWANRFKLPLITSQARKISMPVAFTAIGGKTIAAPDPFSPYLSVASTIMQNRVLHKKIREQGGAYGSGASYNIITGNFNMYSYRDPHLISTIDAFKEAIDTVGSGNFTEKELEEAKITIIQHIDTPVSPGARGSDAYSQLRDNLLPDFRQMFRGKILDASHKNIEDATKKHLSDFIEKSCLVTFCGEELFKKESPGLKTPLELLSI